MNKTKREIYRFLIAGISAVITDLLVYYSLLNLLTIELSKGLSFIAGSVVAFTVNKYWTFNKPKKSYKEIIQFGILYSLTLGINIITNEIMLYYTSLILLSFLIATGFSALLNFVGQKMWVFK